MSKIKYGGLHQYGAEPFEWQQFGPAGVERVKQGGANRSRCMHTVTCNLACTDLLMNHDSRPKLGQSDLLYWSKSPAEKVGVNRFFFKPAQLSLTAHEMLVTVAIVRRGIDNVRVNISVMNWFSCLMDACRAL